MPGEPVGMPPTAMPATAGFSLSRRWTSRRRDVPFHDVAADQGGMARLRGARNPVLGLERVERLVVQLGDLRREARLADVVDPLRAAAAGRRLVHLHRRAPRPRCAETIATVVNVTASTAAPNAIFMCSLADYLTTTGHAASRPPTSRPPAKTPPARGRGAATGRRPQRPRCSCPRRWRRDTADARRRATRPDRRRSGRPDRRARGERRQVEHAELPESAIADAALDDQPRPVRRQRLRDDVRRQSAAAGDRGSIRRRHNGSLGVESVAKKRSPSRSNATLAKSNGPVSAPSGASMWNSRRSAIARAVRRSISTDSIARRSPGRRFLFRVGRDRRDVTRRARRGPSSPHQGARIARLAETCGRTRRRRS